MSDNRQWFKSSFSGNGGCFQVNFTPGEVLIRNSERPDEWVSDTHDAWRAFVAGVKRNEFDLPERGAA